MGRLSEFHHYANTPPEQMLQNWHLFTHIDYKNESLRKLKKDLGWYLTKTRGKRVRKTN
jgi:hypothetical protein